MRGRKKAGIVRCGRRTDCVGRRPALDEKNKNAGGVPPGQHPGSFNVVCGALRSMRKLASVGVYISVVPLGRVT